MLQFLHHLNVWMLECLQIGFVVTPKDRTQALPFHKGPFSGEIASPVLYKAGRVTASPYPNPNPNPPFRCHTLHCSKFQESSVQPSHSALFATDRGAFGAAVPLPGGERQDDLPLPLRAGV